MSCRAITHPLALGVVVLAWLSSASSSSPMVAGNQKLGQCILWADPPGNITFSPDKEGLGKLREGDLRQVLIEIPQCYTNRSELTYEVEDSRVADVVSVSQLPPNVTGGRPCWSYSVGILAKRLGMTPISFGLKFQADDSTEGLDIDDDIPDDHDGSMGVIVLRPWRVIDVLFRAVLSLVVIVLNLGFGCALDLGIVREILRRPIAPAIGACCQFICMPLVGIVVTKSMSMDNIFAFGLLCLSCSPGGGGSNVWSVLLHGDVNLSLTMTFISLIACLGTMPFWIFTLSRFYVDPSQVKIPFKDILLTLAAFVGPCFIGILIRKWRVGLANRLALLIKPLAVGFLIFVLFITPYVNNYIYRMMYQIPSIVAPAMLLPWCGFSIGFLAAKFFKQPTYRAITIAIETGIQNFSISLVLLQQSFPQPFGDLGAVMPLIVAHFTPLPLYIAFAVLTVRDKCFIPWRNKHRKAAEDEDPEKKAVEEEGDAEEDPEKAPLTNGGATVISSIEVEEAPKMANGTPVTVSTNTEDQVLTETLLRKIRKELSDFDARETVL